ncbi:MAG TPA: MSHA biogenesis protein MshJ [Cellvibrio sp.]|nr:MSHA biogenesis protein MshJ [Cellvibrio sp.]
MSSLIDRIQEKIDARAMRERAMIFLSAVAVLVILWSTFIQSPLDKKKQEMTAQFDALIAQRTTMQTKISTLSEVMLNDPERLKEEQIKQLQSDIHEIDEKLQRTSQGLVKASELPQVLQDVLLKTAKLTLLDVATLPVHQLQVVTIDGEFKQNVDSKKAKDIENLGVYEHVVQMRLSGSYFEVVQFLTALEALPWRFYWQRLDYKVSKYPNAEVILRVYTLSSEEGLLGV